MLKRCNLQRFICAKFKYFIFTHVALLARGCLHCFLLVKIIKIVYLNKVFDKKFINFFVFVYFFYKLYYNDN